MEPILGLTSAITLAIFATILYFLIKEIKTESLNKKEIPLIVLALTYLIFTIALILGATNFFELNSSDLSIIFSVVLTIQTTCLLAIQYQVKQNKTIFYTLTPFIFLIPIAFISPQILHIAIPISLLITLLAFITTTTLHESPTRYLITYTSTSLFLYIFTIYSQNLIQILIIISSALFLAFIMPFLKFLQLNTRRHFPIRQEPESPLIHFLKHFVFIIIITNFIFIGTVSVHEFGHLLTSAGSNCEETKIIYELKGLPHTEITCEDTSQKNKWIVGGILLPFIIAIALFFSGGKFIRELSLQIIGFNLIISYLDLKSLNISEAIATISIITGAILATFSLALLVKTRVE